MTENKRFGVITNWCVYEKIDGLEKWLSFDETVTILNQLNDENNQLEEDLDYYKAKCASLETGMFNLERENEQLKSELKYWQTLAQSLAKKNNVGDFE